MLLMIDNYDSFTYNLVQYFGELEAQVKVVRNDEIDIEGIKKLKPDMFFDWQHLTKDGNKILAKIVKDFSIPTRSLFNS